MMAMGFSCSSKRPVKSYGVSAISGHQHPLSLTAFGQAVPQTLKEYERILLKRRTNNGVQTNLTLHEDSEADWLPACSQ